MHSVSFEVYTSPIDLLKGLIKMDLVDMQNISVQTDASPFRYVLVILDVFNHYIIFYGHSNQNHHVKL